MTRKSDAIIDCVFAFLLTKAFFFNKTKKAIKKFQ